MQNLALNIWVKTMALEFVLVEGFEWCNSGTSGVDDLRQKNDMLIYDPSGSPASIDTTIYKSGTRSLKFGPTLTNGNEWHIPIPADSYAGIYAVHFGMHIRQSAIEARTYNGDPIFGCWISTGSNQCFLSQNASGYPTVYRSSTLLATGSVAFSAATWHWLEVFLNIADSGGRWIVSIDGATSIDFTGDTRDQANNGAHFARFEGVLSSTAFQNIDNVFVRVSTTTESDPSFYGDCYVATIKPNSDGNYSAWSSTASPTLYSEIDDAQVGTSSPVSQITSSTNSQKASFSHETFTQDNVGDVVLAVALDDHIKKDPGGGGKFKQFLRKGGADYSSDTKGFGAGDWLRHQHIWENDPSSSPQSAWTESDINNTEFGVEYIE